MYNSVYVWLNILMLALVNFVLLYVLHVCSWKAGIFHAGMLTTLTTGLELVVMFILGSIFGNFELYRSSPLVLSILAIFSKLLYFLSTKVCLWIINRSDSSGKDTGHASLLLSSFSVTSICIMVVLFYIGVSVSLPVHIENLMLIITVMLLFSNILLFVGYQYIQKVNQQNLLL